MDVCVFVSLFWYLFLGSFLFLRVSFYGCVLVVECSFGVVLLRKLKNLKILLKKSQLGLLNSF